MTFDQESALRLATLRAQNYLSPEEQQEVIKLEMAYSTHLREEDPNYQLPIVTMTSSSTSSLCPSQPNQSSPAVGSSTNNKKTTSSSNNNINKNDNNNTFANQDSDDFEIMESTTSSAEGSAAKCSTGNCNTNNSKSGYSSYFSGLANYLPSKETLDTAARATWFYTSLTVGTGAPGFVGKKLGLTDGYDYWNWILLPITSQTANIAPEYNHLLLSEQQAAAAVAAAQKNKTENNNNNSGKRNQNDDDSKNTKNSKNDDTNTNNNNNDNLLKPQGGLILGALPILTEVMGSGNHLKALHKEMRQFATGMGMVVSALTDQEMNGFGLSGPQFANHDRWREEFGKDNMICRLLEVEDCTPDGFEFDKLDEVLQEMDDTIVKRGKCVYVHCAKGKGRSWVVVMCYLIAWKNMTMDAAATLVKAKRHQVNPSRSQVGFVQQFYKRVMERQGRKMMTGVQEGEGAAQGV